MSDNIQNLSKVTSLATVIIKLTFNVIDIHKKVALFLLTNFRNNFTYFSDTFLFISHKCQNSLIPYSTSHNNLNKKIYMSEMVCSVSSWMGQK